MTDASFRTNPDNFCYRHPDRQSFVLCQRCLRTICPECQTQLPVGVICPECRAEAQRGQQATITRMPRRRRSVASSTPVVTYSLVAITTLFYLIGLIPGFGSRTHAFVRSRMKERPGTPWGARSSCWPARPGPAR